MFGNLKRYSGEYLIRDYSAPDAFCLYINLHTFYVLNNLFQYDCFIYL